MRKTHRLTIILLGLALAAGLPAAPVTTLAQIRSAYSAVNTRIKAGELFTVTATIDRVLRGSGAQKVEMRFYYEDKLDGELAPETYPLLHKITVRFNVAAPESYREYVFVNNSPVFAYYKDELDESERRFYFRYNKQLLHIKRTVATATEDRSENFTKQELTEAKAVLSDIGDYRKVFARILQSAR